MNLIDISAELVYEVYDETRFLFHIAAMKNPHQRIVSESMQVSPELDVQVMKRQAGGGNRLHRLIAPAGSTLNVSYRARVELTQHHADPSQLPEADYADLPAQVLPYLNPSRYCESDLLMRYAYEEFGQLQPGYTRVQAIVSWVYRQLSYTPGSTGPSTTACDVLLQRTGVCRDYAHLAIALCRAMGVPARYVSGYAVDLQPPDFHGFLEAWLGDDWYLFDATRLAPVTGLVRIGAGRDAADVSFATLIGNAVSQPPTVSAMLHEGAPGRWDDTDAVSGA